MKTNMSMGDFCVLQAGGKHSDMWALYIHAHGCVHYVFPSVAISLYLYICIIFQAYLCSVEKLKLKKLLNKVISKCSYLFYKKNCIELLKTTHLSVFVLFNKKIILKRNIHNTTYFISIQNYLSLLIYIKCAIPFLWAGIICVHISEVNI